MRALSLETQASKCGRVERFMTNREMVKPPRPGGPKLPEPNLPKRVSVPSPEGDPRPFIDEDPIDSPAAETGDQPAAKDQAPSQGVTTVEPELTGNPGACCRGSHVDQAVRDGT